MIRTYLLTLGATALRLSDVYGDGPGVVNAGHDIPFRQLTLESDAGSAVLGDSPSLVPGGGLIVGGGGSGGAYPAAVLADGATHQWRLNETSGAIAVDSIGGLNCAIVGAVGLGVPGALADGSTAMSFPGGTARLTMPSLTLPAVFSVEAWIKQAVPGSGRIDAIWNNTLATVDNTYLALHDGAAQYGSASLGDTVTTGAILSDGQWHHIVGISTNPGVQIWVDGVRRTVGNSYPTPAATSGGWIGYDPINLGATSLAIDEVALYPLALTPTQIANHVALRTSTGGGAAPVVLGPFATGPLKLSQLYAVGSGPLRIVGVPF